MDLREEEMINEEDNLAHLQDNLLEEEKEEQNQQEEVKEDRRSLNRSQ